MAKKRNKRSPASPETPQPHGRPTKLTPEIQDEIVGYVEEGNYLNIAALLAGVPAPTVKEWYYRGRGTDRDRPMAEPYASFAFAIDKAKAKAEKEMVDQLKEAGAGYLTNRNKTVTRKYRDPQGNEVTEITTEEVQAVHRDWRATLARLERMYPDRWGNQRMAEMEAMKTLIEGGLLPDGVIDALLQGEEERRSRIQRAVRGEKAPENES
jgi:hypothetical protein